MRTVGEKVSWLRAQLSTYPTPVLSASFAHLPCASSGMCFFPGDLGLYDPERERISTIVLGSDWGNEASFERTCASPIYKKNQTVAGTDRKLRSAGFDLGDCFYSNAWPVLREGNAPESGFHPMRDDRAATDRYREYLLLCIEVLEPQLIITLGIAPAWFVGPLVGPAWKCGLARSSRDLRSADLDTQPVQIESGLVFVAATHPSRPNERHRRFAPGDLTENDLLIRARRMANIPESRHA